MKQYSILELTLYKSFVDEVCNFNDERKLTNSPNYHKILDTWWNLYKIDNVFALKALFYVGSVNCPFHSEYIFIKIMNHISEIDPDKCKAIIKSGLIEKYVNVSCLFDLLGYNDDDIDKCVIDHLISIILKEVLKHGLPTLGILNDFSHRISCTENALMYFEKYYGISPELWVGRAKAFNKSDCIDLRYNTTILDAYNVDCLADNCAE